MIDFEKVVRDAASKQGIVLKKDDPAMLYIPLLNNLLDDLRTGMSFELAEYQKAHEDIARRWRSDAEGSAARILNAALDAGREAATKAMNEGTAKAVKVINEELLSVVNRQKAEVEGAVIEIRRLAFMMVVASAIVFGTAVFLSFF